MFSILLRFADNKQRDLFVRFLYKTNTELLDNSVETVYQPHLILKDLSSDEIQWVESNLSDYEVLTFVDKL